MGREVKLSKDLLEKLYYQDLLSFAAIAKKMDMAESTVRYYFNKKYKLTPRDKSEAQKLYLAQHDHQRVGVKHSEGAKKKISQNAAKYWSSDEARQTKRHIKKSRRHWWDSLNEGEKLKRLEAMQHGAKERAGIGSHFEEYFASFLSDRGYTFVQRTAEYTPGQEFIVDMVLPEHNTIIEIDGPVHFLPIFDQETLEKHQMRDAKKNDVLTSSGYCVIRIHTSKTTRSQAKCLRIFKKLEKILSDPNRNGQVYIIKAD